MTGQKKRILILTSSGGGGHLQAALAKEKAYKAEGLDTIIKKDVFLDYLGKAIGSSFAGSWNFCQTHGKTTSLYFFSICAKFVDVLISPFLALSVISDLHHHDIDHIVDTQPIGTKIFVKSLRLINFLKKKNITYEKVLTDLPTQKCIHFFRPIKALSKKDKAHISIKTTSPLLNDKQSEHTFWKTHVGLNKEQIIYDPFPLRPTFFSYEKQNNFSIELKTYSPIHTHHICKCVNYGNKAYVRKKNSLSFTFTDETLSLITLGSFPQKSILIAYMKAFIEQKKIHSRDRKDVLFILVGPQNTALHFFKEIIRTLENIKDYPKNLTIFPLAFQDDTTIAPLYFHLDFILAKSGGLTTMEILTSVPKNIFVHDNKETTFSKIIKKLTGKTIDTMPPWERGNANYLFETKKAQAITPELFSHVTSVFFQTT